MKSGAVLKSAKDKTRTRYELESKPEIFDAEDPDRELPPMEESKSGDEPKPFLQGEKRKKTGLTPSKDVEMKLTG